MKKMKILAAVFLLAFAVSIGSVLASVEPLCSSAYGCNTCWLNNCCNSSANAGMTVVKGKIYEGNLSNGVWGADVSVTCNHNGSEYTRNAVSWHDGKYIVFFFQNQCDEGDSITVSAEKDGLTGTNDGTVIHFAGTPCFDLDVGIVNVPLIPEFGMVIGTLTAVSAIGIFLFVRRK